MQKDGRTLHSTIDADGAAILDIERNRLVSLNATGGYVWERLKRGRTIDEIIQELAHDTGMDRGIVERDVRAFVQQLIEAHFLEE
jgi:hypothetical protein